MSIFKIFICATNCYRLGGFLKNDCREYYFSSLIYLERALSRVPSLYCHNHRLHPKDNCTHRECACAVLDVDFYF